MLRALRNSVALSIMFISAALMLPDVGHADSSQSSAPLSAGLPQGVPPGPPASEPIAPALEKSHAASRSNPLIDQARCDAEVAKAYAPNLYGPGIKKKRSDLFAACMARRADPTSAGRTPAYDKAECEGEVATAYPLNLWGPGLKKKRDALFAACMAERESQSN